MRKLLKYNWIHLVKLFFYIINRLIFHIMHLSEIFILLLTTNIKHFFMQQLSYKFRQY